MNAPRGSRLSAGRRALVLGAALAPFAALGSGTREQDSRPTEHDRIVSNGYSELYEAMGGMRWLDELLLVKFESEETKRVITDLAHYAADLKKQLEQLARDYPMISLADDGLPPIEKKRLQLVERARAKDFAPLIGAKGADFERELLLSQAAALSHFRFLAAALAEEEKGSPREAFARDVQRHLDQHYLAVIHLLDRRFFRPPAHSPSDGAERDAKPRKK